MQQFFNRAAFDLNPLGIFGTLGKGTLRGPGLVSWDMGAFKQIPIGERFTAQFRAEFFNILNHPNFAGPTRPVSRRTVSAKLFRRRTENHPIRIKTTVLMCGSEL